MTDDLTPAKVEASTPLWDARIVDLAAYRTRVGELAADRSLPRIAAVWCASCGANDDRRQPPGVIVDSPDGPLMVTRGPVDQIRVAEPHAPSRWATPGEWRAEGHPGQIPTRLRAWIVDGPNTYAARFAAWRPPDDDDMPAIRCATHGDLEPNVDEVGHAIRSRWRAVRVAVDGRCTQA